MTRVRDPASAAKDRTPRQPGLSAPPCREASTSSPARGGEEKLPRDRAVKFPPPEYHDKKQEGPLGPGQFHRPEADKITISIYIPISHLIGHLNPKPQKDLP